MTAWCWEARPAGPDLAEWAREDERGWAVAYVRALRDGSAAYKVCPPGAPGREVPCRTVGDAFDRVRTHLSALGVRAVGPWLPDDLLGLDVSGPAFAVAQAGR